MKKKFLILLFALTFALSACQKQPKEQEVYNPYIEVPFGNEGVISILPQEGVPLANYNRESFKKDDATNVITYTGNEYQGLKGIDVSFHQGDIDWNRVAADSVDFAYIRMGYRGYTEGILHTDTKFYDNYYGAKNVGLSTGVYFYSQALSVEEARREAEYLADIMADMPVDLPVIFDWEINYNEGSRTLEADISQINDYYRAFKDVLTAKGYETGIYFNRFLGYYSLDFAPLQGDVLWAAIYKNAPDFYYNHQIWQYTDKGYVNGIETQVDLNIWFKEKEPKVVY